MDLKYAMQCIGCGESMPHDENIYTCSACDGLLLPKRDEDYISFLLGRGKAMQEYFDNIRYGKGRMQYPNGSGVFMWLPYILPGFPVDSVISFKEGRTDLFELPEWLKKQIGLPKLYIKMEGQGPSGSFKDRGMPVAVSEALRLQKHCPELGIRYIACASTGDTSASAAAYAAYCRDRISCIVFIPHEKISKEQLAQAMMFGAHIIAIKHPDGFDACMRLIQQVTKTRPDIVLVNSKNAYRIVGQETIAIETFQDLRWKVPHWVSIPVGNAGNLAALLLSCLRAHEHGLIDRLPGIIVAQTKKANTIVRWARSGFTEYKPGGFHDTVASAMNIQNPVSFPRVSKLMREFNLLFYDVEEADIQATRATLNRGAVGICPQGAVAVHAVLQARDDNKIKNTDTVVAISTADALKFASSAADYHLAGTDANANPPMIEETGTLEGVRALLERIK